LSLLQSVVALAGDGDATALRSALATMRSSRAAPVVRAVLAPITEALLAIAEGEPARAIPLLESISGDLVCVAASNAQLDLVSLTLQWCYAVTKQTPSSDTFLSARLVPVSSARATGEWTPSPSPVEGSGARRRRNPLQRRWRVTKNREVAVARP